MQIAGERLKIPVDQEVPEMGERFGMPLSDEWVKFILS